ncbi:MAG: hypothetical protein LCI02_04985 [Proteobacteria bacterium]|nr:hypothetical protein [Pseudomonadota bacterium]
MTELDFSGLTDDQVVDLARAAAREAVMRNPAARAALASAVASDAEQLAAQAAGGAAAKQRVLDSIRARAEREGIERHAAREQQRWQESLRGHLISAAAIVGRGPHELTISDYDDGSGQRVRIVLGANPAGPGWCFVQYDLRRDRITMSPALKPKELEARAWALAFHAATRDPNGVHRRTILRGAELCPQNAT